MASLAAYSERLSDVDAGQPDLRGLPAPAFALQEEGLYALLGGEWAEVFSFDWGESMWVDLDGQVLDRLWISGYDTDRRSYPKRLGVWGEAGKVVFKQIHFGDLDFDLLKDTVHLRTVREEPDSGRRSAEGIAYLEGGLWRPIPHNWRPAADAQAEGAIFCADQGVTLPPPPRSVYRPRRAASGPRGRLSGLAERALAG